MIFEILLLSALIADWVFGDPKWFPHPVRGIGWCCSFFESFFRNNVGNEKVAGIFTSVTILILTGGVVFLFLYLLGMFSNILQSFAAVFIIYTFLAVKDLLIHSRNVYDNLFPEVRLAKARDSVGQIVGRDTSNLQSEAICRACVETVAENFVDGITAPLFWAILFSLLALILPVDAIVFAATGISLYKAANTMDSMFGYKNIKYKKFGWFAARFDDLLNFLPARLSGLSVVFGVIFSGYDWRNAMKIFVRDRLNHSSPNAAHTEAAVAGALGVMLGGTSVYFGNQVEKPTLGDNSTQITPQHILKTHKIVIIATLVFIVCIFLLRRIILFFLTG